MHLFSILILAIVVGLWVLYLRKTKDYIKIRIDCYYKTNKEIAMRAYDELKKKGRECEITKLSDGFSEIRVDDKIYYVTGTVFGVKGGLTQTITLKPIKG